MKSSFEGIVGSLFADFSYYQSDTDFINQHLSRTHLHCVAEIMIKLTYTDDIRPFISMSNHKLAALIMLCKSQPVKAMHQVESKKTKLREHLLTTYEG
jgi:hypothetical protein